MSKGLWIEATMENLKMILNLLHSHCSGSTDNTFGEKVDGETDASARAASNTDEVPREDNCHLIDFPLAEFTLLLLQVLRPCVICIYLTLSIASGVRQQLLLRVGHCDSARHVIRLKLLAVAAVARDLVLLRFISDHVRSGSHCRDNVARVASS